MQLRKLEAARDIATTLSKSTNKLYLSSDSLLLNVNDRAGFDLGSISDSRKVAADTKIAHAKAADAIVAVAAPAE